MRLFRARTGVVVVVGTTALAVTAVPVPAYAHKGVTTVATGLDNPRGLAFAPNGTLYVAEAGRGGSGPCFAGPEGEEVCFGTSGAVSMLRNGKKIRVLTGLPSIAEPDGSAAIGPSDVSFQGQGRMYVTVGLGADPGVARRPAGGGPEGQRLAVTGYGRHRRLAEGGRHSRVRGGRQSGRRRAGQQPELGRGHRGRPGGRRRGRQLAGRGGGQRHHPHPRGLPAPHGGRTAVPRAATGHPDPDGVGPTSAVRGPDGAYYVGELTGFPFVPGMARVHRVVPGQAPQVVAEGFTNIIDIGFANGRLYVLEIAHNGLLSGDPTGALIRVNPDGSRNVVMSDGLTSPGWSRAAQRRRLCHQLQRLRRRRQRAADSARSVTTAAALVQDRITAP